MPPAASRKGSERAWQKLNHDVPDWVKLVEGDPVRNANWFKGAVLRLVSREGRAVVFIPSSIRASWLNVNFKRATVVGLRRHGLEAVKDVVFTDKGSGDGGEA